MGTLLLAPVVAVLGIIALSSVNRSEVTTQLTTVFVVLLRLSILGHPQYILALTRYSATALFSDEMAKFMTGYFLASILFHVRQVGICSPFLVEPAVLFSGGTRYALNLVINPFSGGKCRVRDLQAAERMHLYQAA